MKAKTEYTPEELKELYYKYARAFFQPLRDNIIKYTVPKI